MESKLIGVVEPLRLGKGGKRGKRGRNKRGSGRNSRSILMECNFSQFKLNLLQ